LLAVRMAAGHNGPHNGRNRAFGESLSASLTLSLRMPKCQSIKHLRCVVGGSLEHMSCFTVAACSSRLQVNAQPQHLWTGAKTVSEQCCLSFEQIGFTAVRRIDLR